MIRKRGNRVAYIDCTSCGWHGPVIKPAHPRQMIACPQCGRTGYEGMTPEQVQDRWREIERDFTALMCLFDAYKRVHGDAPEPDDALRWLPVLRAAAADPRMAEAALVGLVRGEQG